MVVFGILGLFSARYRSLAKESFRCAFRLLVLKPCDTNLDQRIKSKLTARLLKRSPKTARFIYRNFTLLSVIFVILFFASLGYSAYSVYNLIAHGTCAPGSNNCIFNPEKSSCGTHKNHNGISLSGFSSSTGLLSLLSKQYKTII